MKKGRQANADSNMQQAQAAKLQEFRSNPENARMVVENARIAREKSCINKMTQNCADYTYVIQDNTPPLVVSTTDAAAFVLGEMTKLGYSEKQITQNFAPVVQEQYQQAFQLALKG
jgi:capsid protein